MNRKILSALLIAVITILLALNTNIVTNEKQETEKLTVAEETKQIKNGHLNSGISKELSNVLDNLNLSLSSGITKEISDKLFISMSYATISINETEKVAQANGEEEVLITKYTTRKVNLRTAPDINSDVQEVLNIATPIQIVDEENNNEWYKVKKDDSFAYIHRDYVSDTEPILEYIGEYKLTYYTDSVRCCGTAGQKTASGIYPTEGIVAADASIPFGTKLVINGNIYSVQDRGSAIKGKVLDVYKDLPDEALLQLGVDYADVFIYRE